MSSASDGLPCAPGRYALGDVQGAGDEIPDRALGPLREVRLVEPELCDKLQLCHSPCVLDVT